MELNVISDTAGGISNKINVLKKLQRAQSDCHSHVKLREITWNHVIVRDFTLNHVLKKLNFLKLKKKRHVFMVNLTNVLFLYLGDL